MSDLLSDQERKRFSDWLLGEAEAADVLAQQADKIPSGMGATAAIRERVYAAACLLVVNRLKNTETMILKGD